MRDDDDIGLVRGLDVLVGDAARQLPPVDNWHPAECREIDMRIDRRGRWFYAGSPIRRDRMVRLFASILRRDADERYYLVTPVEKCAITVEDAPFIAVTMDVSGVGHDQALRFVTNIGDSVRVDTAHPLRFERGEDPGAYVPYVTVRGRLEARIDRAVFYDLVELGVIEGTRDGDWFGLWSAGRFWPVAPAAEIAGE